MRPIVYVAGPFRGPTPWDVERNVRAAEEVALMVARWGAVPLCPHTMYRHFDKVLPDTFWLDAGLRLLDACDAAVFMVGWRQSAGARGEFDAVMSVGGVVFDLEGDDVLAFRRWVEAWRG